MPYYDYECGDCGAFTESRPMSEYDLPSACPNCGASAPRVILQAPHFALMEGGRRAAHETNERSRHEPKRSKDHVHHAGCGCGTSSKKKSRAVYGPDGAKTFPSARPWQISH